MADKITGFLIDVTRQMNARPVEFENNLENIYQTLLNESPELIMDEELRQKALVPIQRMLELS